MHRAAVYLNNVSCAHIERGAYEEALDSLRDAVLVMKATVNPNSSNSVTMLDIHTYITKADHRMASLTTEQLLNEDRNAVYVLVHTLPLPRWTSQTMSTSRWKTYERSTWKKT
jgi:hypothetical protein